MLSAASWRRWIDAGIFLVNHICHPVENRIFGQQEIVDKFGIKCNFLEALSIRTSIPHSLRASLSRNFSDNILHKFELKVNDKSFDVLNSNSRLWYEELVRVSAQPFSRAKGWDKDLNLADGGPDQDWNTIFKIPFQTTRETKLQSFAYKLIFRLTPCNKYLHMIGIKDNPKCSFCPEIDNIPHFFCRCIRVKPFWSSLHDWFSQYLDCSLSHLSEIEVILGLSSREPQQKLLNWVLMYAKFYIQKKKLFYAANISLIEFLAELKVKLSIEKRACLWEGKPKKFQCWNRLSFALR